MQNRFSEFLENNRIPEGLSNIFEDSSPKVFFWQVIRTFDFLSLSADSRYFQSEPLNLFIMFMERLIIGISKTESYLSIKQTANERISSLKLRKNNHNVRNTFIRHNIGRGITFKNLIS